MINEGKVNKCRNKHYNGQIGISSDSYKDDGLACYIQESKGTSGFKLFLLPIEESVNIVKYSEHRFNLLKRVSSLKFDRSPEKLKIQKCFSLKFTNHDDDKESLDEIVKSFKLINKRHKERKGSLKNFCRILDKIHKNKIKSIFSNIIDGKYHQRLSLLQVTKTKESLLLYTKNKITNYNKFPNFIEQSINL